VLILGAFSIVDIIGAAWFNRIGIASMTSHIGVIQPALLGNLQKEEDALKTVFGTEMKFVHSSHLDPTGVTSNGAWNYLHNVNASSDINAPAPRNHVSSSSISYLNRIVDGNSMIINPKIMINGNGYNLVVKPISGRVVLTSLGNIIVGTATGTLSTPTGSQFPVLISVSLIPETSHSQMDVTIDHAGWPISIGFGTPFITQSIAKQIY